MSWQERDALNMKITTGDGKVYDVLWKPTSHKTRWHASDNSYIDLNDTLVVKRKRQGRIFPLELYFTGDDHLEDAAAFRTSLDDPNPCTIEHPYYNTIVAHILELDIDNSSLNVSRINCTAAETMVGESATINDRIDIVQLKKVELDDVIAATPERDIEKFPKNELESVKQATKRRKKLGETILTVQSQIEEYQNAFQMASTKLNAFTSVPLQAMLTLTNLLNMPAQFVASVKNRIRILKEQFDVLRQTVSGLFSPAGKRMYVAQQATVLSAICRAAVTPQAGDYQNATVAIRMSVIIAEAYAQLLEDFDELKTNDNSTTESFVVDHDIAIKLEEVVQLTVSGLYQIALSGRRQRVYIVPEDTNIFLLTHLLYRLDPNDERINELKDNNGLLHRQIALGIKKGTTITYFI